MSHQSASEAPVRPGTAGAAPRPSRAGLGQGLGAYGLWGLMPLYFMTIAIASPTEIVASRIVFSLVFCLLLITITRSWDDLGVLLHDRPALRRLSLAAVLITVNWVTYAFAVLNGHAVEASLGYFINPLVSAGLGVLFLKERLTRLQWTALGFGLAAVLVLTFAYGSVPVIALTLAFSFGLYGFVKNRVGRTATAVTSLTFETAFLTVPALVFLGWLISRGEATVLSSGPGHFWLMAASGIVTAVPLLLFGAAARRLPLSTLGTLQFLNPGMQFIIAVAIFGEAMPAERLAGFALVWVAIILVAVDMLRRPGPPRMARRAATAPALKHDGAGPAKD
ncbi:MAG: EamA family transporter RarD [Micrococcaceae bacterium]|nr:EamA family transporter RarD [Micrococcaceae bacterium]